MEQPTWEKEGLVLQEVMPMEIDSPSGSTNGSVPSSTTAHVKEDAEPMASGSGHKQSDAMEAMLKHILVEDDIARPTRAPPRPRPKPPRRGRSRRPSNSSYSSTGNSLSSSSSSSTRQRRRPQKCSRPRAAPPTRPPSSATPQYPPGDWGPPPGLPATKSGHRSFAIFFSEAVTHPDFDLEGLVRAVDEGIVTIKGMALRQKATKRSAS